MKQTSPLEQILQSVFFKNARRKAGFYIRDPRRLNDLLQEVGIKSKQVSGDATANVSFLQQVATLIRMLRAFARGEYKTIPWQSLLLIVAVLLYFVSPLDFIPDLLPLVGFTDDVALLLWVVRSLKTDIQHFREWEGGIETAVEVN